MRFRRKIALLFPIMFFILTSGCVPILVGTAGLATGYTLSNDAAIGNIKSDYHTLWKVCNEVLEDLDADINETKESAGLIKAVISEHAVKIKIDTILSDTQRLKISARKNLLPKPQFAQKIFLQIVERLK
ncbi:MAG: DUF3568 domain-containing protein [Candidatus Omnitrophica bacterium]|nr:DUF3568 domain-containing protein [Candidatus Omnitrophota bacterium]